MKILLSLLVVAVLGAILVAIAVQTIALALGLLVVSGRHEHPFQRGRTRAAIGKCVGVAAGSSLAGLAPLGIVLAPACSFVGVRYLFRLSWRQTAIVVLAATVFGLAMRWML